MGRTAGERRSAAAVRRVEAAREDEKLQEYAQHTERQVVEWIEAVTGERRGRWSTAEWLRSGLVLCQLVNRIVPGLVKESSGLSPSRMIENIRRFLQVAQSFGLHEDELFSPLDLLEQWNLNKVLQCIKAFAEAVPFAVPAYRGPLLGVASRDCATRCTGLLASLLAPLLGAPPAPATMPVNRFESYAISSHSATGSLIVKDRFSRFAQKKSGSLGSSTIFESKKSVSMVSATNSSPVEAARSALFAEVPSEEQPASPASDSALEEASTACGSERSDLLDVEI